MKQFKLIIVDRNIAQIIQAILS